MQTRTLILALPALAAIWNSGGIAAQHDYAYTTNVRLSDGRALQCAVNEPLPADAPAMALSTREQTEADVLATQRLRLLAGPRSDYPTPYTAPIVRCRTAG
ncbi:hypothetical protein [Paraburkholderia azotifigens]|uniref:DUF4124 domain-containing protein n=1 Tax=Paraburkholderia azotifigens TaxID=2057004 RepID=A0A5C6VL00_9BURK|nr:hypothetical protein [Paraburkholderia azotifigens]TXC83828.1 hypothetical protein FRZ40_26140 [Paraburkholderia azotifigens]